MMKTLYFDCFSGISGDMTIGALLDLGLDLGYLKTELKKLPVEGYELKQSRVTRSNISATKFDVDVEGDDHHHHHHHSHHRREHTHDDEHTHDHHEPRQHFHRKASEILGMIDGSSLTPNAKRIAREVFTKLAISEGKVHNIPPEDVEFHEVGAVDSIVDCVGAAIGFDALGIERFVCGSINVGGGFIHCQHGIMPVPAPATADLLRNATIYSKQVTTELVTPTGAAILAAVVGRFGPLQNFVTDRIGYGAGTKEFPDFPNCVRLLVGEERQERLALDNHPQSSEGKILVIEANIDDMTPQNFSYVTEKLLGAGALDVFTLPIQMKKGRPGHLLQVLAPADAKNALSRIIFEETTTIGIRSYGVDRTVLEREFVPVDTPYGKVNVKVSRLEGQVVNFTPEFEECARIARERRVPLKLVQAQATAAFLDQSRGLL
jgi:pyridinium-3,5-bisthiocarboxylic acid mononucleotide nickel chelatase